MRAERPGHESGEYLLRGLPLADDGGLRNKRKSHLQRSPPAIFEGVHSKEHPCGFSLFATRPLLFLSFGATMSVRRHIAAGREGAGYTPRPCTSDCTTQHSNDVAPQAYYIRFEFHLQERRKGRAFAFWRCWVSKSSAPLYVSGGFPGRGKLPAHWGRWILDYKEIQP